MEEDNIPTALAAYLNQAALITVVPEAWREDCASLWLAGTAETIREYVDGSAIAVVPFEVRVRCAGVSVKNRLDAVALLSRLTAYVRRNPPESAVLPLTDAKVVAASGPSKSTVYDDGTEEYRASFVLRFFREAPAES